uniref:Uncharacterized protein n=1 Tax=Amphimedon queenslandica TaxID=400682 RepID=A0A1X7TJ91_AMPQE
MARWRLRYRSSEESRGSSGQTGYRLATRKKTEKTPKIAALDPEKTPAAGGYRAILFFAKGIDLARGDRTDRGAGRTHHSLRSMRSEAMDRTILKSLVGGDNIGLIFVSLIISLTLWAGQVGEERIFGIEEKSISIEERFVSIEERFVSVEKEIVEPKVETVDIKTDIAELKESFRRIEASQLRLESKIDAFIAGQAAGA